MTASNDPHTARDYQRVRDEFFDSLNHAGNDPPAADVTGSTARDDDFKPNAYLIDGSTGDLYAGDSPMWTICRVCQAEAYPSVMSYLYCRGCSNQRKLDEARQSLLAKLKPLVEEMQLNPDKFRTAESKGYAMGRTDGAKMLQAALDKAVSDG